MTNAHNKVADGENQNVNASHKKSEIIAIRPVEETMTLQKLPYFPGISGKTAGSEKLSLNMVIIPPGGAAEAHYHNGYETALFILKGRVKTLYGKGLQKFTENKAGDFLFIPANLPHQPLNLSKTEPVQAIVARNDPNEQESVVLYNPEKDR